MFRKAWFCFVLFLVFISFSVSQTVWEPLFMRTSAMKSAGMSGGDGGQYQTCMERGGSDNKMIVSGIDVGEIRKSADEGATWVFPKHEGLRAGGITSVLVHPTDANIMYTYGHYINYKVSSLTGVYKTTNGGDNWTRVLSLSSITTANIGCSHHQLEFEPGNPSKIYFGSCMQGFHISTDGGTTWTEKSALADKEIRWVRVKNSIILVGTDEGEIWKSTNNGDSWTQATGITAGAAIGALVFLPTDSTGSTVYAVKSGDQLYKSINGGSAFSAVAGTSKTGVYLFDISPANASYMYLMSTDGRYIYWSHTGDAGWSSASTINNSLTFIGSLGNWIGNASTGMSLSPTDPNKGVVSIGSRVYKTIDGGETYNPSSNGYSGYAHGWGCDPAIFFDKTDKNKMWTFNLDFGAVYTIDGWDTATAFGGDDTYFEDGVEWGSNQFGGVVLPSGRVIVIGGEYFNNTIKVTDNLSIWRVVLKDTLTLSAGADGSGAPFPVKLNYAETIQLNPQSTNVIYCANLRSDDGGDTWHEMADGSYHILGMYKKNGDVIYAKKYTDWTVRKTGGVIYKSSDKGNTWAALPDSGVNLGYAWNGPAGFAVDPVTEDRFYAASTNKTNSIYKYDAGVWSELIPKAGRQLGAIAVDPTNPRIVYASVDSKGEPGIYKSPDFGVTWESVQYNMPMTSDFGLVVNPHDGTLYSTGHAGMWKLTSTTTTTLVTGGSNPLSLVRCYPNPFNPAKAVGGTAKIDRMPANCTVKIFSVQGELLNTINESDFGNNGYVEWNGKDTKGDLAAFGVYMYLVEDLLGNRKTGKVALIK